MTITYSCIANGRAVLAELALTGGSYQVLLGPDLRLGKSRLFKSGPCRARPSGRRAAGRPGAHRGG